MLVLILFLYITFHILNLTVEKVCSRFWYKTGQHPHWDLQFTLWKKSLPVSPEIIHRTLNEQQQIITMMMDRTLLSTNSSTSNSQSGGMSDAHILFSAYTTTKFSLFSYTFLLHPSKPSELWLPVPLWWYMAVVRLYFKVAGIYIRMECIGLWGMSGVTERLDPQPGLSQEINGTRTQFQRCLCEQSKQFWGKKSTKHLRCLIPYSSRECNERPWNVKCNIASFFLFACVCMWEVEKGLSATECFSKSHIRLESRVKCFPLQGAP